MKYVANPVVVDAFRIVESHAGPDNRYWLKLENGDQPIASAEMCSRMKPAVGDYWVIQSDGYVYLNPKEVFERKYRPQEEAAHASQ